MNYKTFLVLLSICMQHQITHTAAAPIKQQRAPSAIVLYHSFGYGCKVPFAIVKVYPEQRHTDQQSIEGIKPQESPEPLSSSSTIEEEEETVITLHEISSYGEQTFQKKDASSPLPALFQTETPKQTPHLSPRPDAHQPKSSDEQSSDEQGSLHADHLRSYDPTPKPTPPHSPQDLSGFESILNQGTPNPAHFDIKIAAEMGSSKHRRASSCTSNERHKYANSSRHRKSNSAELPNMIIPATVVMPVK